MTMKSSPNVFPPTPRRFAKRAAFTMVEMLTTVAIIAVLAALIMPNVSKGIASAKTAQCSSNLRQIGAAALNYIADNGGRFPVASGLDRRLAPYLDIKQQPHPEGLGVPLTPSRVWQCPMDPKPAGVWQRSYGFSRVSDTSVSQHTGRGVFARTDPNNVPAGTTPPIVRTLGNIKYPSYTIMAVERFEGNARQDNGQFVAQDGWLGWRDQPLLDKEIPAKARYYHGGRAPATEDGKGGQNYLFCDGHVELLNCKGVLAPRNEGWTAGHWSVSDN